MFVSLKTISTEVVLIVEIRVQENILLGKKIFLLLNNTVSIKQQLKRNSCHTCASSGPRFFLKLDFVVNIRKTAGTPLHILKKPSVLAEFNGIRVSFLQRPDLPPQFLQLVRRHWSWVIHVTDALPADFRSCQS